MPKKRKNGEGSWGSKTIKGYKYKYYRNPDGKYTYGKTEKEVKQKLKEKEKKFIQINNDTLFGDYLKWYLDTIHKNLVEITTYNAYKREAKTIRENKKYYNLLDIKMKYFSKNHNYFQEYITAITPYYSLNSIKCQLTVLRIAAKYAEDNDMMIDGVIERVKLPKESNVGVKAKIIPFFDKATADKIYKESLLRYKNGSLKYGSLGWTIVLCMHTGLRIGELSALKWEDIDIQNKILTVDESKAKIKNEETNEYTTILKSTKTDLVRQIPLNSIACEMIKYFDEYNKGHTPTDYVCLNRKKNPIQTESVRRTLNRILKNIGMKDANVGPHTLRHTFGSILYENGVQLKEISKLLGHSSITTTANIYIGVTGGQLHDAVKVLE